MVGEFFRNNSKKDLSNVPFRAAILLIAVSKADHVLLSDGTKLMVTHAS